MSEQAVEDALKDVIDPELGINIVDLGLLYEVTIADDGDSAHVLMTLTTPGCPLHQYFRDEVSKVTAETVGCSSEDVEVEFTFDPPWSREKISDEGQAQLGFL